MKILYFYPENPLLKIQGNNARANKLLDYFNSRNFTVDFVGELSNSFSNEDAELLKNAKNLNKVFLLNGLNRKRNKIKYLFLHSIPNKFKKEIKLFNRLRFGHKNEFTKILIQNEYDVIIISYLYWSNLVDNKHLKNAKLFIDTHDFLTAQFQTKKGFSLGKYFENEIKILQKFDEIFVISPDEKFVFSQFISKPIHVVTHAVEENQVHLQKKYDLIYVASDNEHNVKSIKWFMNYVYPLLPINFNMIFIGKIVNHVADFQNINKIEFADDLTDFYSKSKVALCPMLTGTGLKIKVVEALSFGLPVVCNERGVDGLLNKINNGCLVSNVPEEFANHIISLLENETIYKQNVNDAINYFRKCHLSTSIYEKLDVIFSL